MTTITVLLSLVGLGGLGIAGLSAFGIGGGFLAGIVAWFVAKNIPWKMIAICAAVLIIALATFAGYQTFKTTQRNLEQARVELAQEKIRGDAEKARGDNYVIQHDAQILRIQKLEADRSAVEEETSGLREQIRNMTLEEDFNNDAARAIANLGARNKQLNRLLERASRNPAAGGDAGAGAGNASKASPAAPVRRTLFGLWKTGVPQAK